MYGCMIITLYSQCCRKWPDQYYGKPHICPSRTLFKTASTQKEVRTAASLCVASVLRDSWIKKSIHGKSPWIKKMRRDQAGTPLPRVYTRIFRFWRHRSCVYARRSMRRRCKHIFRVCLRQCAKGSLQIESLSATNRYLHLAKNNHSCWLKLLDTELVLGSLHRQTSFVLFLVSFFKRFLGNTMVTRTHILWWRTCCAYSTSTETAADSTST